MHPPVLNSEVGALLPSVQASWSGAETVTWMLALPLPPHDTEAPSLSGRRCLCVCGCDCWMHGWIIHGDSGVFMHDGAQWETFVLCVGCRISARVIFLLAFHFLLTRLSFKYLIHNQTICNGRIGLYASLFFFSVGHYDFSSSVFQTLVQGNKKCFGLCRKGCLTVKPLTDLLFFKDLSSTTPAPLSVTVL